jgi:hypothetical protein
MGIVNKRNAALGWLTWLAGKRWLRRKARRAVPVAAEGVRKGRRPAFLAGIVALGGALLFWRKRGADAATRD